MKYFMGLDLSLSNTGVCIINQRGKIVEIGSVKTEPQGRLVPQRFERYRKINQGIYDFAIECFSEIEVTAIEGYSFNSKSREKIQIAESAALARDLIYTKFESSEIIEVYPLSLKKFILGNVKKVKGNTKNIMCREVWKKYKIDINDDNQVDAFLLAQIALCKYNVIKSKTDGYQKYQLEVVETVIKKIIEENEKEDERLKKLTNGKR